MSKDNCNPFAGGEIPPCSDFLGNLNPIIKDGKLIFRNYNRVFYFIGTNSQLIIQQQDVIHLEVQMSKLIYKLA